LLYGQAIKMAESDAWGGLMVSGQVTTYGYAKDNRLASKTYTATVNTTPNVTYTWDTAYPRLDMRRNDRQQRGPSVTQHRPLGR
jgi:hypothetical protein